MNRCVEFSEILARIERIALAHYLADPVRRIWNTLPVAMAADHHRPVCIQFLRVDYLAVDCFIGKPAGPSDRRRRQICVFCSGTVTCTASDAELSNFGICPTRFEVKIRLSFNVVAENAICIPLGNVLLEISAVRIKERSVQAKPSALWEVVSNGQAKILAVLFRDVLLYSARPDRAFDLIDLPLAVGIGKRHEKLISAPFHLRFDAQIFVSIVLLEIALNRLRRDVLRHAAVKGSSP